MVEGRTHRRLLHYSTINKSLHSTNVVWQLLDLVRNLCDLVRQLKE